MQGEGYWAKLGKILLCLLLVMAAIAFTLMVPLIESPMRDSVDPGSQLLS